MITGQTLDEFFAERILRPLGMDDTRWWVDEADTPRTATLYGAHPQTGAGRAAADAGRAGVRSGRRCWPAAHGLISTAADYHRFTQMLLREGELDGVRLLGPHTVRFMTRNHLPGGADLQTFSAGGFAETTIEGIGFGLGFAVIENPVPSKVLEQRRASTTGAGWRARRSGSTRWSSSRRCCSRSWCRRAGGRCGRSCASWCTRR